MKTEGDNQMSDEKKTAGKVLYNIHSPFTEFNDERPGCRAIWESNAQAVIDFHETSQWRKPEELPPDLRRVILCYDWHGEVFTGEGFRFANAWNLAGCNDSGHFTEVQTVTAWRELPTPPTL